MEKRIRLVRERGRVARVRAKVVCRHFAVHRKFSEDPAERRRMSVYTVTHIPTGAACGQRYPSEDVAVGVARQLAALPIKWATIKSHEDVPKRLEKKAKAIIARASLPWDY